MPSLQFKMFLLETGITDYSYTVSVKIQIYSASIWNCNLETHILKVCSLSVKHTKIFIGKKEKDKL